MNRKKLIFLDIDGTLLDSSYASNDDSLPEILEKLQSSGGYVFGLNSNRSIEDMLPIAKDFSIKGPLIGENGIFAHNLATSKTEYFLDKSDLAELKSQKEVVEEAIIDCLESKYENSRVLWRNVDTVEAISKNIIEPEYKEGDIVVLNNSFRRYTTSAHVFIFKNNRLNKLPTIQVRELLKNLSEHKLSFDLTITYDPNFCNILVYSNLVSKRSAVEKIMTEYSDYELYSIGDEINDYYMTKNIGTFLAVGNATKKVREKASFSSISENTSGVVELLSKIKQADPAIEELEKLGFTSFEKIDSGHTDALLYRANNSRNEERVIKIGSQEGDNSEINANRTGYESIYKAGAMELIPKTLQYGVIDGRDYINMPYLGDDIASRDTIGKMTQADYELFFEKLISVVSDSTKKSSKEEQLAGITSFFTQLKGWAKIVMDSDEYDSLLDLNLEVIVSNKSSIMIQDFTPDNTFLNNGKIDFTDPWKQDTYRGSFIPSLAQFISLSTDIYKLPSALKVTSGFKNCIQKIGKLLDLTDNQFAAQESLGESMQHFLSAYVREGSDPKQAKRHMDKAKMKLKQVSDIIHLIELGEAK